MWDIVSGEGLKGARPRLAASGVPGGSRDRACRVRPHVRARASGDPVPCLRLPTVPPA